MEELFVCSGSREGSGTLLFHRPCDHHALFECAPTLHGLGTEGLTVIAFAHLLVLVTGWAVVDDDDVHYNQTLIRCRVGSRR